MRKTNRVPADLWYFVDFTVYPPVRHNVRCIRFLGEPVWHGLEVVAALELPADGIDDDVVTFHPGWETPDGLVPWIPTFYVKALAEDRPDFLEWLEETLASITAYQRGRHLPGAIPEPVQIIDHRAETFSIVAAAQLLRRDPTITGINRETLLGHLKDLAWVTVDDGKNIPTPSAIAAGHLVLNELWTRTDRTHYNRVRVTRAGLLELHQRLGGAVALQLDQLTPTLVDA